MEDPKILFGKKLRKLRKTKGLSQEKLAFACNLDRTYICEVECGKRNISLENIFKLARALQEQPENLLIFSDLIETPEKEQV